MADLLGFLTSMVTVLFGGYIALFFLNRIQFSIEIQYNKSYSKEVKGKNSNEVQEDSALQMRKNKM
ncbi:hypothetical protein [Paenibacillus radicis (ex Gao et al. 2016)]|uniref:Uncharacterized protein n=1 Tax=Paenibacillus radicis (ex Gao et al. 2016) TaxID=1737354 RepID=A0A917HJV6_9BACL|nr:hypothetical protein [Paenibacillus radicis (ex Gao et al. 2016)]GGG82030.1 hypothetical protein GCM10010918_44210 [Paenibacillus radicis (ex Gao et al. 2016)]